MPKFKTCKELADALKDMGFVVTYVSRDAADPEVCVVHFKDRYIAQTAPGNIYLTSSMTYDLRTGKGSVNIIRKVAPPRRFFETELGEYCAEPYNCRIHVDFDEPRIGLHIKEMDIDKDFPELVADMQLPARPKW